MRVREIVLDASSPAPSYTMRVGDILAILVRGTGSPTMSPRWDPTYFRLVEQWQIGECPPNASCAYPPGSLWRLVALRAGGTAITLSFACRQSRPPCMVPDRAIEIAIRP
jgi:hypothetical protein